MPASAAVTICFYVFGRSTGENQAPRAPKAATAALGARGSTRSAASILRALMQYVTGKAAGTFRRKLVL